MTAPSPAEPPTAEPHREQLVWAALPLLLAHGQDTTPAQVAHAAGVAEDVVTRTFPDAESLRTACLAIALRGEDTRAHLAAVDPGLPLVDRLTMAAEAITDHATRVGALTGAPTRVDHTHQADQASPDQAPTDQADPADRTAAPGELVALFESDRAALRTPPERLAPLFQALAVAAGQLGRSPGELVDLFLHGALTPGQED
ncbi:Transcriptional regulator, TetR family [Actinokineospora spheciospongiae]|uniref:Transcriptional regulator, TetR family n=1 Tax=Actinokineospora spheciospongiae TaxID=909613 RepID=W7J325_9PSEU|nr:hypothetical protein [Actinokineospora spheciospongiae]EWC63341.1 Transcriptional regulator, TetR family [Actinokineospora spheciospongiae]